MRNDEIVQSHKPSEVAELRWDGPIELIRGKGPKGATMIEWEHTAMRVDLLNADRLGYGDDAYNCCSWVILLSSGGMVPVSWLEERDLSESPD